MSEAQLALDAILAPVRAARDVLVREIQQLETELAAKREEYKRLQRVMQAADPKSKPGPKPAGQSTHVISDGKVQEVQAFLAAFADKYRNGDGFTASSLHRDMQADGLRMSQATVNSATHALRERGVIRLLRRGTGGSRVYQLT